MRRRGRLRTDGVELPQAIQAHIDRWLADGPRARHALRPFIQWARQRHLVTGLDVPPIPVAAPSVLQDDQEQWKQLRRCLHETTMPVHFALSALSCWCSDCRSPA